MWVAGSALHCVVTVVSAYLLVVEWEMLGTAALVWKCLGALLGSLEIFVAAALQDETVELSVVAATVVAWESWIEIVTVSGSSLEVAVVSISVLEIAFVAEWVQVQVSIV